jgi:hypothetical protein
MSKLTFKEISKDRSKAEYALACRAIMKEAIAFADDIGGGVRYWEDTTKYYPKRTGAQLSDLYCVQSISINAAMICKRRAEKPDLDLYLIKQEE